RHGATGGHTTADALFAGQTAHGLFGRLLVHVDHLVDPAGIENAGQVCLWPAADAGNGGAIGGLQANDAHVRVLLLEVFRHAHDGTGGAHGGDEVGNATAGIAPDFRAGALIVRQRIVRIGELV